MISFIEENDTSVKLSNLPFIKNVCGKRYHYSTNENIAISWDYRIKQNTYSI